jgi:hypothetical protein
MSWLSASHNSYIRSFVSHLFNFTGYWPLTTLVSPRAPCHRPEIGFVFPVDPAFIRAKSQCVND